eukprot:5002643-Amphidinium_carterae.1
MGCEPRGIVKITLKPMAESVLVGRSSTKKAETMTTMMSAVCVTDCHKRPRPHQTWRSGSYKALWLRPQGSWQSVLAKA